jgi:hypothetical protein
LLLFYVLCQYFNQRRNAVQSTIRGREKQWRKDIKNTKGKKAMAFAAWRQGFHNLLLNIALVSLFWYINTSNAEDDIEEDCYSY